MRLTTSWLGEMVFAVAHVLLFGSLLTLSLSLQSLDIEKLPIF